MKPKKLKVYSSFSHKKIQKEEDIKTETQTTEITTLASSSRIVQPPAFINQIRREWPSWSKVKQETGIYRPPSIYIQNGHHIQYVKSRQIPLPKILGRGHSRYYKYYCDEENSVTYFYPFSSICPQEQYEKVDHMLALQQLYSCQYLSEEGIMIVPTSLALPQIEDIRQKIKNNAIKFEKVSNWFYAY